MVNKCREPTGLMMTVGSVLGFFLSPLFLMKMTVAKDMNAKRLAWCLVCIWKVFSAQHSRPTRVLQTQDFQSAQIKLTVAFTSV